MKNCSIIPRFIRLRDAPWYVGMDKNRFNEEIRPYLLEIKVGIQGKAFDRVELDAIAEEYKNRNGRPGRLHGESLWDGKRRPDSSRERVFGTSTRGSTGKEFARALERLTSKKRSNS